MNAAAARSTDQPMRWPAALLAFVSLAGCTTTPPAAVTTLVLVRHAEKVDDGSRDLRLSAAGEARAKALTARLAGVPLRAVYATDYLRTQQTAAPVALARALPVLRYDAKMPAADFAARLRHEHAGQAALVVGHSNTVPELAAALCRCAVAPMSENEYGRRLTVRIAADGTAMLEDVRDE